MPDRRGDTDSAAGRTGRHGSAQHCQHPHQPAVQPETADVQLAHRVEAVIYGTF